MIETWFRCVSNAKWVTEVLTLQRCIAPCKEIKKPENKSLITIRMQNQEVNFYSLSSNLHQIIPKSLRNSFTLNWTNSSASSESRSSPSIRLPLLSLIWICSEAVQLLRPQKTITSFGWGIAFARLMNQIISNKQQQHVAEVPAEGWSRTTFLLLWLICRPVH